MTDRVRVRSTITGIVREVTPDDADTLLAYRGDDGTPLFERDTDTADGEASDSGRSGTKERRSAGRRDA